MQLQSHSDSPRNPTARQRSNFREISEVVGALLLSMAGAVWATQNTVGVLEVRNRLQCGQTMQEVRNDHYNEHPAIYRLLFTARIIGGSISQPSPHRDERCFKDGEYMGLFPYTPVSKSKL